MAEWAYLFKIGIALFAIVNPIGSVPIFISATNGWSDKDRARTAKTVAMTVFLVLTISAFLGDRILAFFSISIASFQVGGGILLLLIAIAMMHGKQSYISEPQDGMAGVSENEAIMRETTAIVPLSVPLLAGPGAISSMIIAAEQSGGFWGHASLALPIAIVCLFIWITLRLSTGIAHKLGGIGISVVTRLMGLILAAMAVEFIAHGIAGLFPRLAA